MNRRIVATKDSRIVFDARTSDPNLAYKMLWALSDELLAEFIQDYADTGTIDDARIHYENSENDIGHLITFIYDDEKTPHERVLMDGSDNTGYVGDYIESWVE